MDKVAYDAFIQNVARREKRIAELEQQIEKMKKGIGLMRELLIALKIYGAKYNVSLIADAEQFLNGENIILEDAQAGNSPFDADEVFNKEVKAYPEEKVK